MIKLNLSLFLTYIWICFVCSARLNQTMKTHNISCSYGYFPGTVGAFYVRVKILSGSKFRFCCGGSLSSSYVNSTHQRVRWTTLNIDGVSVKLPIIENSPEADFAYPSGLSYTVLPRLKSEFIETIKENETPVDTVNKKRQGPSQYGNINKIITGSDINYSRSIGRDILMITEQITDEMTLVVMNTSVLDGTDQANYLTHENYIDNFLVRIMEIDTST